MNMIADTIARRRKELGLTQKELAERLNVSDKTLSRWETGKQIPDALTLLEIAKALGLSISEMYGINEIDGTPQPQQHRAQKRRSDGKILKIVGAGFAVMAVIMLLIIGIGSFRLQSKVTCAARDVPMYALTSYDNSVLDWIKRCNESGEEINCLSSMKKDPETGEEIAHYLFYLPHGYADTKVRARYRFGMKGNTLNLDFRNTTRTMDDNYYLCYMTVVWEGDGFGLKTTLEGKDVRLQFLGFANYFVELCGSLFPDE